jgi:hypothetical protein
LAARPGAWRGGSTGRNELRRAADRIETAVIILLAAAFPAAAVAAACLAGHLCQSEHMAAARLRPAMAVLSQPGPATTTPAGTAGASWRRPNGTQRSATLTTVTAPAIYQAPAGTTVQILPDNHPGARYPGAVISGAGAPRISAATPRPAAGRSGPGRAVADDRADDQRVGTCGVA